MSGADDWKERRYGAVDVDSLCAAADARIAELEADHASVAKAYDGRYRELMEARARIIDLEAALAERDRMRQNFPSTVCLCGSTRFKEQFIAEALRLELAGHIALSMTQFEHADGIEATVAQKAEYDALHRRKIDLADEVHVLNVGGYIGESTRNEIAYAESTGRTISYLEPLADLRARAEEGTETP